MRLLTSSLLLLLLLLSRAAANNSSEPEVLPSPEPWSDQPLCPLWGPMEGFYSEGIEAGRVGLIKETMMIYWYFLSIWEGGGYKTRSPSCQIWGGSAWAKCTVSTLSTRQYIVTPTIWRRCKNTNGLLLSERSRTDKTDKLSSKVAFYRGNQPRSQSGLISFEDIKDSNLLKYTERKAGKRDTCLTQYLASHQDCHCVIIYGYHDILPWFIFPVLYHCIRPHIGQFNIALLRLISLLRSVELRAKTSVLVVLVFKRS